VLGRRQGDGGSTAAGGRVSDLGLVLPVVLIVFVSGVLIVGILFSVGRIQDSTAVAVAERTVASLLRAERRSLGRLAKDYAWYDLTIEHVLDQLDPAWIEENIGDYLSDAFDVSATVVIGGDGRPVFAALSGKPVEDFDLGRFGPGFANLLRDARASVDTEEPTPVSAMVMLDGALHFAAASLIMPEDMKPPRATPDPKVVLVLLKAFDDAYMNRLAVDHNLAGLGVASAPEPAKGAGVTLKGPGGGVLGWATWKPRMPGRAVVRDALPLIAICLVLMLGALGVFLYRVRRVAEQTTRDAAQLAERNAALERTEGYLGALLDSAPAVLFALDGNGVITLFRGRGLANLDVGGDGIVGQRCSQVFAPWPEVAGLCQRALAGESVASIVDTDAHHFHIVGSPVADGDGAVTGMVGIAHDVTDRIAAERALRQAQKLEAVGELAGGIAHEMNNLLQPILGLTELAMLDLAPGSKDRERLERVATATIRATDLVKQILDFSRADPGAREPIAVDEALEDALALVELTMPTSVALEANLDCDCVIVADRQQLRTVLLNLVANARDALQDSPRRIHISCGRTDFTDGDKRPEGLADGSYALLRVANDGMGMTPAVKARAFEPFFTTKSVGQGTGLGLATVHGIVESHGGTIRVISEPGRGSMFEVYLPLATGDADRLADDCIHQQAASTDTGAPSTEPERKAEAPWPAS